MLIATDKNGISRRVIYNENVLLIERGDNPMAWICKTLTARICNLHPQYKSFFIY